MGLGKGITTTPDVFNQTAGLNWDAQTKALSLAEMLQQNAWQRGHGDATLALQRDMYENPNAGSFQELFTNKAQRGGLNQMLGYPEPNLVGPAAPVTGEQDRNREIYSWLLQGNRGGSMAGRAGKGGMGAQDLQDAMYYTNKKKDEMRNYAVIQAAGYLPNAEGGSGVSTKTPNDVLALMVSSINGEDFSRRMNGEYGGRLPAQTMEGLKNAYDVWKTTYDPAWEMQTFLNYGNMWQGETPSQEDWLGIDKVPKTFDYPGPEGGSYTTPALPPNPWGQKLEGMQGAGGSESSGFNFGFRQPMTFAGGGGNIQPVQPVQQPPRSPNVTPTQAPTQTRTPKPTAQKSSNLVAAIRAVKADLAEPGARISDPAAYWQAIAEEFPGIDIAAVKRATGQK